MRCLSGRLLWFLLLSIEPNVWTILRVRVLWWLLLDVLQLLLYQQIIQQTKVGQYTLGQRSNFCCKIFWRKIVLSIFKHILGLQNILIHFYILIKMDFFWTKKIYLVPVWAKTKSRENKERWYAICNSNWVDRHAIWIESFVRFIELQWKIFFGA